MGGSTHLSFTMGILMVREMAWDLEKLAVRADGAQCVTTSRTALSDSAEHGGCRFRSETTLTSIGSEANYGVWGRVRVVLGHCASSKVDLDVSLRPFVT